MQRLAVIVLLLTTVLAPLTSSTQIVAGAADPEAPKVPQAPPCTICITEYMYSGADGAFVEFTNFSGSSIDMTGWSFDDSHRQAGSTGLSAFGMVEAGESVILTEASPSAFRTAWGLDSSVKIIQGFNHGLGRNDEINLYDNINTVVDQLTYNDQSVPATIRAKDASGWVGTAELGNNNIKAWRLSVPCDMQNSIESTGGNLGNPGRYVPDDTLPTAIPVSAPTPYLSLSPDNTGFVSGAIDDPTDPAATLGITFTVSDPNLSVTATSRNASTVPQDHLNLSQVGDQWNLKITPAAIGCSRITVHANDGVTDVQAYSFGYAASEASVTPANTRFHTGASDASTAIAVGDYMLVGDDENQNLRLYNRHQSGLPVNSFDFTANLGLAGSGEVDIEASTRVGDRIYWLGSHSNGSDGSDSPNRRRLFATDLTGSGTNANLSFVGYYAGLRDDLVLWDQNNGNHYGLANSIIGQPERADGFNIEGLAMAPGSATTAYIGFRAPLVPTSNKALIVPVSNLADLVSGTPATGPAQFGTPIELDLGGRGIRSIERNSDDQYLIVAGPPDSATGIAPKDFRLYSWTGNAGDAPQLLPTDLTGLHVRGSFEAIVDVPSPLSLDGSQSVQLLVDNGDTVWYGGLVASKHLPEPNIEKFRSEMVTLGNPKRLLYLPIVMRDAPTSGLPNFSHIFVIVMENKERSQIVNNPDAPFINYLRSGFAEAANYYGIRHPSLPNYLTLTAGHTFGISTDCTDCYQNAENIVTQLEAAGRSWKAYQEDMPSPCFVGDSGTLYRQKHNPFIYYDDVRLDPARCNKIVPFTQFKTDLEANTLPDFVWITPNMCSDMHDCSIGTGDSWLNFWVQPILNSPAWQNNGVLFITFDEGTSTAGCCNFDPGGGKVVTLVLSPLARQSGFASTVPYNHYSLLRTIEQAWGLPFLGHAGDASIQSMTDFFQTSSSTTHVSAGAAWK